MENSSEPILAPLEPAQCRAEIRKIIQEELSKAQKAPAICPWVKKRYSVSSHTSLPGRV